jgi:tetratricopeptide (TPR) repeat protein
MMAAVLLVARLVAMLASAPTPDDADATAYVRAVASEAAAHVEAGRYDEAVRLLDEAEQTHSDPAFVYMRASIEGKRGNCDRAIALYRRYLKLDVPDQDAAAARRGLQRCEAKVEASRPSAPVQAAPAASVDPPSDRPPERPGTLTPWYADPWGTTLAVTGAAVAVAGVALLIQTRLELGQADDAAGLAAFDEHAARAERFGAAGVATVAVGSAVAVAGIIRWAVVGARNRQSRAATARRRGQVFVSTPGVTFVF